MVDPKKVLSRAALAIWISAVLLMSADLLAAHLITLPEPDNTVLERSAARVRADGAEGWMLIHVLSEPCGCSRRIFDHLLARQRPVDVRETILLVGADARREQRAAELGISIRHVTRDELSVDYGIDSVPLLIAVDPQGRIRYAGGYTERKQGPAIRDISILEAIRRGEELAPLPLFGCAVSKKLEKTLDPLGLR